MINSSGSKARFAAVLLLVLAIVVACGRPGTGDTPQSLAPATPSAPATTSAPAAVDVSPSPTQAASASPGSAGSGDSLASEFRELDRLIDEIGGSTATDANGE